MDDKYSKVGLYKHNIKSYEKIKDAFKTNNAVALVQATGTGKMYNALQLMYDNKDKQILFVVPSNGIIEHIYTTINDNPKLDLERDFSHVEFRTYQSLVNMSKEELENIDVDMLILDEFHHIGAPIWGARIDTIIKSHSNIMVLGMTAYTVRDRGTIYERDMVNPNTDELFSNKVASNYDLCDAMIDGVLPKPIYKSAYVNLISLEDKVTKKVQSLNQFSKEYKELNKILKDVKRRIQEAPSIADVIKKNIKRNGKYIYFCPPRVENGVNDILTIMQEAKKWFLEMGLTEDKIVFYVTTSEMGNKGKINRNAFYNDVDLDGEKVDDKLRVMFAINQYNEGIHAPNIDGVIMGRGTTSDIVFFEQLGRTLAVKGKTREKIEEYEKYSIEELIKICADLGIEYRENQAKEEIIERIVSPIIIDLTNNISFIKELEDTLKIKVKEIENSKKHEKGKIKIRDISFDIEIENEDLFEILRYVMDRLTRTWEDMYEYAKIYYEHYGNLEVPRTFKTNDGYTYDENGIIHLGKWISYQKSVLLDSEKGKKLLAIGMHFEKKKSTLSWKEVYEYAKKYYEHHGNLEVPDKFKTNDGYTRNENGTINLGMWITNQRQNCEPKSERGKLLLQIGMRFETKKNIPWEKMYEYAKKYYEYYGNLEVPQKFKTSDGCTYDENGKINLGKWIVTQRQNCDPKSEKGKLLLQIGMRFENKRIYLSWKDMYKYAKKYYEQYGNLEVPYRFKTNDGYTYDKNGIIHLGEWIARQRKLVSPESERGKLLLQIGMCFESKRRSRKTIITDDTNYDEELNGDKPFQKIKRKKI